MKNILVCFSCFAYWLLSPSLLAQTSLPALFSDHMVLQQNALAPVWGNDEPNTAVTITTSWGKSYSTSSDEQGDWRVKIATPAAGGPFQISIRGSSSVKITDIMMGEVWLAAGQSNMEMPIKGFTNQPVLNSNQVILHSAKNKIRLFNVKRNASVANVSSAKGQWQLASPETTGNFSATAYFFAEQLSQVLDVPIGIISTSWGGSNIEAWMSEDSLAPFSEINIPQKIPSQAEIIAAKANIRLQQLPTVLYHGMLKPLAGYGIKGAIWYQGEANRRNAVQYQALQPIMVNLWRKQWQQGNFPFYYTQIAPFNYWDINSAFLREAQLKAVKNITNSGLAITLDTNQCSSIHPSNKQLAGQRLSYWALAQTYHIQGIEYSGPQYQSHQVIDTDVIVNLSHAPSGISSFGHNISGFELAGADRIFHPATANIVKLKNQINLNSPKVSKPVAIRYAFSNCPNVSIFSNAGLPLSSFRTDSWPIADN